MHVGRDVDVDADVEVLELGIDGAAEAALERSGGDGHAIADLERGLFTVHDPDLRPLDDLAMAVGSEERERDAGNGDRKVAGGEMSERIQGEVGARRPGTRARTCGS